MVCKCCGIVINLPVLCLNAGDTLVTECLQF